MSVVLWRDFGALNLAPCIGKGNEVHLLFPPTKLPYMSVSLYPLASLEQIEETPSRKDGIPSDLEDDLRAYGCKLIHQAGILLKQYASFRSKLHSINVNNK